MKEHYRKNKKRTTKNKTESIHHIYHRRDKDRLKGFNINAESNKIKLPNSVHQQLHHIIDSSIYKDDLTTRVYFANMAYNDSLSDIPEGLYRTNPVAKRKT